MSEEFSIVISTFADQAVGTAIINALLDRKLAACVQVMPISSHYFWEGMVANDSETLMLIKSKTCDYAEIENCIRELHDYKVPEILRVPISGGSDSYLSWVREVTR